MDSSYFYHLRQISAIMFLASKFQNLKCLTILPKSLMHACAQQRGAALRGNLILLAFY